MGVKSVKFCTNLNGPVIRSQIEGHFSWDAPLFFTNVIARQSKQTSALEKRIFKVHTRSIHHMLIV